MSVASTSRVRWIRLLRRTEDECSSDDFTKFSMRPIGVMRSPLQKNGAPRQGNLAQVRGVLRVSSGVGNNEEHALEDLHGFSHVWILWVFHQNRGAEMLRNKVRPPKVEISLLLLSSVLVFFFFFSCAD